MTAIHPLSQVRRIDQARQRHVALCQVRPRGELSGCRSTRAATLQVTPSDNLHAPRRRIARPHDVEPDLTRYLREDD